jgi:signal transduction histidine kinase/CheY-like chemotaxis protein
VVDEADTGDYSLLRDFQRVALALAAEQDLGRLLELLVTECREVTDADAGSLYLVEVEAGTGAEPPSAHLRFVVAQNASKAIDVKAVTLPLDRASVAGYVALTRTPLNVSDVYALRPDVEFAFNPRMDRALGYRTVSMLVVPMVDHVGQVVGVVQVINKKRSAAVRLETPEAAVAATLAFGRHDEAMVTALAGLAAVAIQGRRAEQARLALEEQLRQSQKMDAIGRLAGGIAHDFNNLLTVITGRTELLRRRLGLDHALARQVELIRQTAEQAAGLTRQLLIFGRKQVLQPRLLDLNAIVTGMAPMLRSLAGERVELAMALDPGLGGVMADAAQMEQVVLNLVINARDAMPKGGRVAIETANAELDEAFVRQHLGARAGQYVRLAVTDTGVGMDASTQAHLFEPFFTTKGVGKGTGLGLATVYAIVKQGGGYVRVITAPGQGARFEVHLPLVEGRPRGSQEDGQVLAQQLLRGAETILLVEDQAEVRQLARDVLHLSGYTILEAPGGPEALRVHDQHPGPIHLLLTDVIMPHMSGPELAERLAALRPALRVLYMSGYTADALGPHGVLNPGIAFLPKPFAPGALLLQVRGVLDGPRGSVR